MRIECLKHVSKDTRSTRINLSIENGAFIFKSTVFKQDKVFCIGRDSILFMSVKEFLSNINETYIVVSSVTIEECTDGFDKVRFHLTIIIEQEKQLLWALCVLCIVGPSATLLT